MTTLSEIIAWWTKMSDAEIEDILKKGDCNQDGTISYSEFARMLQG